jgi:hypothetical protein
MRCFLMKILVGSVLSICMQVLIGAYGQISLSSSTHPLYINRVYDFKVSLPTNVIYTRTQPPNPDHGFAIVLPGLTQLYVDASYTESSSTEEEIKWMIKGCQLKEKQSTTLGGIPAVQMFFSCDATATNKSYEKRVVLSTRKRNHRSPICYKIEMRTYDKKAATYEEELFMKLVTGFSFIGK